MRNAKHKLLFGVFSDEEDMMKAGEFLKDHKVPIHDIYTPFPVHGLDEILQIRRSRLPYVTFLAALLGCGFAFWFQIWTSKASWPLNIGGKPFNSFVAFIPVAFEITVLFGALITVAFFFYRCGLFPGKEEKTLDKSITNYNFVIAIEHNTSAIDPDYVTQVMKAYGASEVRKND